MKNALIIFKNYRLTLFVLVLVVLVFSVLRSTFTQVGDFKGYILVGNLALQGKNIYTNPSINTWPPFFTIVCVPLAILANINKYFVHFVWLTGSIYAMYLVVGITTKLALKRSLTWLKTDEGGILSSYKISFLSLIVLIPLLISLRYIIANIDKIQINIFMLLFALLNIYLFTKHRYILAGLILAFSISIKVYTIFILFYFLVKREFRISIITIVFCLFFALVPFVVFGAEQTLDYYTFWYENNIKPFASINHKNQSYFSLMRSLLHHESPGLNGPLNKAIYLNIAELSLNQVRFISYGLIGIMAMPVIYLFRHKLKTMGSLKRLLEYTFILNLIPILSPLSWKAYFIFLFPSYFINYLFIYQSHNSVDGAIRYINKPLFFISIVLTVFSTELFVGKTFSDILETFSCITVGAILIAINLLIFYTQFGKHQIKV